MRKSVLTNLIISLGSVVLLLLAAEWGFRFYLANFGNARQQMMYLYSSEDLETANQLMTGAPYLNYGLAPAHPSHNSLDFRGDEITRQKPPDTWRAVALGGSTTYGTYLPQAEQAYPAQLQVLLHADAGPTRVQVINAGVPGYKTWETLINFSFRALDLDPDLIIVYHAVNDVSARLVDPAQYDGMNASAGVWQYDMEPLPASALYRFFAIRLGWMADPRAVAPRLRTIPPVEICNVVIRDSVEYCDNFDMPVTGLLALNPPVYFERNLRHLIVLAQANDVAIMLSTWAYAPQPFDHAGGDHMTFAFRQQAVAEHNAIIRALAAEYDVPLLDFATTMPDDDALWIDGLHVSAAGAQEQAAQYAAFLRANDLIDRQ